MKIFLRQDPVRCKMVINNNCLQQVKNYKYLSCEISYEYEKDSTNKQKLRLTSIKIRFFRRTAGYTLYDNKRNEEILEELKVEPADKKLQRYKSNSL